MASPNAGPITPTDQQIHTLASRVVFRGLQQLDAILSGESGAWNYEKISALSHMVQAGSEGMLPPADKPMEFDD